MKKILSVLTFISLFCFTSCLDSENTQDNRIANMSAEELAYNFPHLFDAPPPQEFVIDTEKDTVIFGKSGTLFAIEAGTFTDESGNPLNGNLTLNLKEALSLSEMLEHKLTTQTTDGQILQSGGMFELTAKSDKKGKINISKPIYAEIPTQQKIGNMSVYEGIQVSENAPVQWKKEKELENWLTEIPLERLDFFPKNEGSFEKDGKRTIIIPADKIRTLETYHLGDSIRVIDINEENSSSFLEQNKKNFNQKNQSESIFRFVQEDAEERGKPTICGISKYILKGLSDRKFQGTFISTYEFEKRVKAMNECCGNDLIAIYLKNLDENLWEADQKAAEYLTKNKKCRAYIFEEFAAEGATKVKPKGKVNRALKKYIDKLFKEKEKAWAKFEKEYQTWDVRREELQKEVTDKYETERKFSERVSYAFSLNRLGWTNIDKLINYENRVDVSVELKVKKLKVKEAARAFLIFPKDKVILHLSRNEKGIFYIWQGNQNNKSAYLPKDETVVLKVISEKENNLYTGEIKATIKSKIKKVISLDKTTDENIAIYFKQFENEINTAFNESDQFNLPVIQNIPPPLVNGNVHVIREDNSAKKFEQALSKHYESRPVLDDYAECCYEMDLVKGKQLFENECKQCHGFYQRIVGPALLPAIKTQPLKSLINFTKYPEMTIMGSDRGNRYYNMYSEYGQMMPNHDHLSDGDIRSILYYVEKEATQNPYSELRKK
ncbi:cytochrome c [Bernardetia sp. ABR2-2B]|uniref:c-type cytochrome n=1 Tax=Bernardetia sp. ABR2-2B TaxID=3127472 RepID=UPI0030D0E27D